MIRSLSRGALPWVVALFIACCVVQVFLAGLGVFESAARFEVHASFAFLFGWLTLIMLVLAIAARGGRRVIGLAALILVMFALQSVFVELRATSPAIAALHPVNGFGIILVAILELRASLALAKSSAEAHAAAVVALEAPAIVALEPPAVAAAAVAAATAAAPSVADGRAS